MKRNAFLALIILSLWILPLSAQRRRNQSRRLTIDEEAQQQAASYWNSVLTPCGDSYYTKMFYEDFQTGGNLSPSMQGYWIYQFKGISIRTEGQKSEQRLSEADILNGRKPSGETWSGKSILQYRVARLGRHEPDASASDLYWSQWSQNSIPVRIVNIRGSRGDWHFNPPTGGPPIHYTRVKCDLSDIQTAGVP